MLYRHHIYIQCSDRHTCLSWIIVSWHAKPNLTPLNNDNCSYIISTSVLSINVWFVLFLYRNGTTSMHHRNIENNITRLCVSDLVMNGNASDQKFTHVHLSVTLSVLLSTIPSAQKHTNRSSPFQGYNISITLLPPCNNILTSIKNGLHHSYDIVKYIFLNEILIISFTQISLKYLLKVSIKISQHWFI